MSPFLLPFMLFYLFLKIGGVSFGGAYTIWAMANRFFGLDRGDGLSTSGVPVVPEDQMRSFLQIAHVTPGPNINGILLIGDHYLGPFGIVLAFVALLLPSALVMAFLYHMNRTLSVHAKFEYFKRGALAAVIGVLLYFFWELAQSAPRENILLTVLFSMQACAVFYFIRVRRMNSILVTFLSGAFSWLGFFFFQNF